MGLNNTSTSAITGGGIDSFTVGSVLNANGQTYSYFGFWGSATAGNNGWSVNGEFIPLPADSPGGPEPEIEDPTPEPEPEPEPDDPLDPGDPGSDVGPACELASRRLVNLALSNIGITDAVLHLGTEASRNAETARLHYRTEIDAVLRAHPWKFATRYATLTRVSGSVTTPLNGDWTYRYRLPADCLLVRRIVPDDGRQRTFDPQPAAFDTTEDVDGGLLDTNAEVVEIEYTARPPCPARVRDAIFRRACTWRLAHAFAPPLGRDKDLSTQAYQLYIRQIREAEARDQNEQARQHPPHIGDAEWHRFRD